ncbi:hypothetical protein L204_101803 [Cryptococcus depauperatus]|nr:selenoprotein W [Cryptococcus depauperatus CBS 7855]
MSEECTDCIQPPLQPIVMASNDTPNPPETQVGTDASAPQATIAKEPEPSLVAPDLQQVKPSVVIEFCDRCRWAPRATWIQTELFLTFPNPLLKSITLMPLIAPETGGRFRVWVDMGDGKTQLAWDRKTEGGFPELKVLKQRIRNLVQPDLNLGHSDVYGKQRDKPDNVK